MGSDWTEVSLSELTTKITKGTTPTKKDGGFSSEGVNYIKSEAVTFDGRIDESKFTFISSEIHKKLKRSQLEESDILMSMAGIHLGKTAIVRTRHLPANTNQALALIRPIRNKIYPDYLFYFLQQSSVVYFINNSTSQSAQPNINLQEIGSLNIKYPEYNEQKAIAHILGSLDDKIELNRQMNETLEAMAQALFKSWFVDFDPVIDNALAAGNAIPDELLERAEQRKGVEKKDNSDIQSLFPDEFELTEEMGWIPRGWAVGKYSDLAELNPLSWSKKSMPEEISYVDLGNTNNGKIDLVVSYSSSEAPSRAKRVLSTDDTIIGTVRPGNRSFAFIHNEGLTGSTGFAVMKPIESINRTYIYLGLTQSIVIDYFAHIADGGAYPAINPSVVADLECIIPPSEVLEKFDDLAYCFLKKIGENSNHNETLAKIRDTLLPKLMSGELRIPDANALVDEAV